MQSSEFTKSLNLGRIKKITAKKTHKIYHLKIEFYSWKNIFLTWNMVYSDRYELLQKIKNFNSVESYDEITAENYRNYYFAEKCTVSRLSKISIQKVNSTNWRLEWRLCQNCKSLFLFFPRNKPSMSDTIGSGRFNFLFILIFPYFFKGFRAVWISSRWSIYDWYWNFIRLAHS